MLLSRPQIIYCMLGINQLVFQNMIDSCTANSIINNLSLELLKECEEYSNSLIDSLSSDESDKDVIDVL